MRRLIVHVVGSGSGLPGRDRDTTSLLIGVAGDWTLVDCPGSVVQKLARLGLRPRDLSRVVLTHNHVDHVYGFPHLVHAMAIAGGAESLAVYAPLQTLETIDAMVDAHRLDGARYPTLDCRPIEMQEKFILVDGPLCIVSSPAAHGRDTVALRFESGEVAVCCSSDTRPCGAVERLAGGAHLLFHDCGGPHRLRHGFVESHTSAREAGEVATAANVGRLVLIHLSGGDDVLHESLEEARSTFSGAVELAVDEGCYRVRVP